MLNFKEKIELCRIVHREEFYKNYFPKLHNEKIYKIAKCSLIENSINYKDTWSKIKSNMEKYRRILKRIKIITKKRCWFITLTISDENLKKDHVRKIKEIYNGKQYIFNEDYGKNNNRKHYHGIVQSDTKPNGWNYGFTDIKEIHGNNQEKIAKYINKLTAHTLKEKAERTIYSRARAISNNK